MVRYAKVQIESDNIQSIYKILQTRPAVQIMAGLHLSFLKKEIKLLCKDCCRNVYPSGMLLGMGSGRQASSLTMGKQAEMSLADIFEACQIEEYASVDEQYDYFNKWCDSLRG